MTDREKFFHGPDYLPDGNWNSKSYICCRLCKTKNSKTNRTKHWSKGLCRSCYRRLNIKHRMYNDSYNNKRPSEKESIKKEYKSIENLSKLNMNNMEIESLLDRYEWSCAYCHVELQDYNHKLSNAFQLEYLTSPSELSLIPICRTCNCSKKNIVDEHKLKQWCKEKKLDYPVNIVTVEDYLNS